MDMYELTEKRYDYFAGSGSLSGMDWLKRFKEQYDHLIWLNPEEPPRYGGYWGQSYGHIARLIDMYPLSVDGLERGLTAGLSRPIRPLPEMGRAITRDSHRSRNRP